MPYGNDTKLSIKDFAGRIRTRYPGAYDHVPDRELAERVIHKYPVYADSVDMSTPAAQTQPATQMTAPAPSSPFPAPIARMPINAPVSTPPNSTSIGQPRTPQQAELQYTLLADREQQPLAQQSAGQTQPIIPLQQNTSLQQRALRSTSFQQLPQQSPGPSSAQDISRQIAELTAISEAARRGERYQPRSTNETLRQQPSTPTYTEADFTAWVRAGHLPKTAASRARFEAELRKNAALKQASDIISPAQTKPSPTFAAPTLPTPTAQLGPASAKPPSSVASAPSAEKLSPTTQQQTTQPTTPQPQAPALPTAAVSRQTPVPKYTDADFTKWAREKGVPKTAMSRAAFETELRNDAALNRTAAQTPSPTQISRGKSIKVGRSVMPAVSPASKSPTITVTNEALGLYQAKLEPDNSPTADELPEGKKRFRDPVTGETYLIDPTTRTIEDESMKRPALVINIARPPKEVGELARPIYIGQIADAFSKKFNVPKSDVIAYYDQLKVPILDLSGSAPRVMENRELTGGGTVPHTITARQAFDMQQFSDNRREQLKVQALEQIALGRPFSPEEQNYFTANEVDLDKLRNEYPSERKAGEAVRAEYERRRQQLGGDQFIADLDAQKSVRWINDAQYQGALRQYQATRDTIRKQLQGQVNAGVRFGEPDARKQPSEADVNKVLDEARAIPQYLSKGDIKQAQEVADWYNQTFGDYGSAVLSTVMSAGAKGLKTVAGVLRPLGAVGLPQPYEWLRNQGLREEIAAARMGETKTNQPESWTHWTIVGGVKLVGQVLDVPRMALPFFTPLGKLGGVAAPTSFAATNFLETYGSGAGPKQVTAETAKGYLLGSVFGPASQIEEKLADAGARTILSKAAKYGTIFLGATGTEIAGGTPPKQAINSGVGLVLFDALVTHAGETGQTVADVARQQVGKVFDIITSGKKTRVAINGNGGIVDASDASDDAVRGTFVGTDEVNKAKMQPQGIRQHSFEPTSQSTDTSTTKGKEVTPGASRGAENETEDTFGPEDEDKKQGVEFRDGKWQFTQDNSTAGADKSSDSSSPSGFMDKVRKMVARYRKTGEHDLADALQEGAKGVPSAPERTPNVTLSEKAGRALDVFRAKAQAFLPKWRGIVGEFGRAIGLSGEDILNPDEIKGRERSAEKYAEELEKGVEEPKEALKDTLRASFVIETPEQGRMLKELIYKRFPDAKEKNRFKNPLPNEYSDALIHVDLGHGLYGEIQVHVREMLDAKEISHLYYEKQRTLEALGGKRTPEQDRELERLDEAQRKLHAAARRAFTRRTKFSLEAMWP